MGPIQTFADVIDLLRRRGGMIALIVIIGAVSAVAYALSIPHRYASTEVIQIERPRVAGDLAPSTVMGSSARRLQLIEQKLMSRGAVLDMIKELELFTNLPALTDAERLVLFRQSVTIDGVAAVREGPTDDGTVAALSITAEFGTPEKAQAVAHRLAERTIDLSAAARADQTRATLDFFLLEEASLVDAISQLEDEIAAFRGENTISTTGRIAMQQTEIASVNDAILTVERSRIAVEREVAQIDQTSTRPATKRRLEELNRQLDVVTQQGAFLQSRLEELRASIQTSPEVESRISIYESRLEQYQNQLESVANRRRDAEIGHRMETNRQAETMRILERAPLPDYPVESKRRKIAAVGFLGSMALGLGLALLLDMMKPVVRSSAQMKRELGIMPAAVIPYVSVRRQRRSTAQAVAFSNPFVQAGLRGSGVALSFAARQASRGVAWSITTLQERFAKNG